VNVAVFLGVELWMFDFNAMSAHYQVASIHFSLVLIKQLQAQALNLASRYLADFAKLLNSHLPISNSQLNKRLPDHLREEMSILEIRGIIETYTYAIDYSFCL